MLSAHGLGSRHNIIKEREPDPPLYYGLVTRYNHTLVLATPTVQETKKHAVCDVTYCLSEQALLGPTAACMRSYHGLTAVSDMISLKAAVRSMATKQPKTQTSAKFGFSPPA